MRPVIELLTTVVVSSCVLLAESAFAIPMTFNTSDSQFDAGVDNQGWYGSGPGHFGADDNDNYFTGAISGDILRSFFSFDLSSLSGVVTGATLELQRYGVQGDEIFEPLGLFDVPTDAATLNENTLNPAIFSVLGSGKSYGEFQISTTSGMHSDILSFALNSAAIGDINAAAGGFFSIGASLLSISSPTDRVFSGSSRGGVQRLVLDVVPAEPSVVPEPATLALLGLGLAGMGVSRRRRPAS